MRKSLDKLGKEYKFLISRDVSRNETNFFPYAVIDKSNIFCVKIDSYISKTVKTLRGEV